MFASRPNQYRGSCKNEQTIGYDHSEPKAPFRVRMVLSKTIHNLRHFFRLFTRSDASKANKKDVMLKAN